MFVRAAAVVATLALLGTGVAHAETIRGTDGDDRLTGTPEADRIGGSAGDDTLRGLAGKDRLRGHRGADVVRGNRDRDSLDGGLGPDRVYGGAGSDDLIGGFGIDSLYGGTGNDTMYESSRAIHENNRRTGADLFRGGRDDDRIYLGGGADVVQAGRGDDFISIVRDWRPDRITCGPGNDTVSVYGGLDPGDRFRGCEHFEEATH